MLPQSLRGRLALVAVSVATVALAPLAPLATTGGASAVEISGARTLSDTVHVDFTDHRPAATSDVHLLAFNDFHGNLEPGGLTIYGRFAGGAAFLAKAVKDRQAQYPRDVTVFAGDNIGASPLANALFDEEPAVIVSNHMNVDAASVGNHEFDKGAAELVRIQRGGCPAEGCSGAPYARPGRPPTDRYPGADFTYLSTNVVTDDGRPLLTPTFTKTFRGDSGRGFRVGFIGETLQATPTIVTPSGVAGLTFQDEAEAANRAVRTLRRNGVKIPILIVHQGGFQSAPAALNGCAGSLAGSDLEKIVQRLDPSIKVIVSAHTHAEYRCTITTGGVTRLVTSASAFGRILSDITLTVDDRSGELVSADATNTIVDNALNAPGPGVVRQEDPSKSDPTVAAIVAQYVTASAPLANQVIGTIQGDLTRSSSDESTLGDVIADAQLAATAPAAAGSAQIAVMNPGGIRADLRVNDISSGGEAPGEVTFGEAFTVQPFGNSLVVKTFTGAQLRELLEQQFAGCRGQATSRTLQISAGFSYQRSATALPASPTPAQCAAKIGTISLGGTPIDPAASYRVTMNSFLATGGDGFTTFNAGTDALGGAQDIDALIAAFTAAKPAGIAVPPLNRIVTTP
ncbi:MAG: bifunctional metallophosphatase/5'-nucleotidase [Pseudonocardiaceae bacterium]